MSYAIPLDLCPEHSDVFLDGVASVARATLWTPCVGRLTDPLKAHTGYGSHDRIIELIVEGYKP